jgi:PhnB protein
MQVQTYLFFDGHCEEAAKFYCEHLGAQITSVMRYSEMPASEDKGMVPPGSDDKIMHMEMRMGDAQIMASDGMCSGQPQFEGFGLLLTVADDAEAKLSLGICRRRAGFTCRYCPTFFAQHSAWSLAASGDEDGHGSQVKVRLFMRYTRALGKAA